MNDSRPPSKIQLTQLINDIRNFPGLLRKQDIGGLLAQLPPPDKISDHIIAGFGEDSALISLNPKYDLLLFHSDAIVESLVESNPFNAGMSCVIVNVNDIFAAAGHPVALTSVVSFMDSPKGKTTAQQLMAGAAKASQLVQVPIVGGHTVPKSSYNAISMACVGVGKKEQILQSSSACPGDLILYAIDLNGQRGTAYSLGWDCFTFKSSQEVLLPRNAMIEIGKQQLASASKDSSIPGILGSTIMLLEASGLGGVINIDKIPYPNSIPLQDWIKMFLSTGFILTTSENKVQDCIQILDSAGLTTKIVGQVTKDLCIYLTNKDGETSLFFDLFKESIFGTNLKHL